MANSSKRDYLKIEAKKRTCKIEGFGMKYLNYCLRQQIPTEREQKAIDTFNIIYKQLKSK